MPEGHPLRPGDPTRLGAYRLVGRLGEGSQGVVYLGRDASGTPVAIKLLHARMADHPKGRERFVRELSAAKKVARFCTAQVLDADLAGDQPYIVSEYVEGRSLRAEILDEGPRSGGALERLAISTLTALAAIHRAGIIHRDFTPHNVLLGPDGPRVIDFGIARALDGARHNESNSVGTPAYMAPEQVLGDELGPPTDMFAWGATILFAATGRPPFGNESVPAVMERVLHAEADVTPLPEPLRSVVARCLSKDPAQRPTAEEAHAALLGQEPVGPLSPPPAFGAAGAPADPVEPKEPVAAPWADPPARRQRAADHLPPAGRGGAAQQGGPTGPARGAEAPGAGEPGGAARPGATPVPGTAASQAEPFGHVPGHGPSSARDRAAERRGLAASAAAGTGQAVRVPADAGGLTGPGQGNAAAWSAVGGSARRTAGRLPVRWAVAAGAGATVLVTAVAVVLWPNGGDAATSAKTTTVDASPSPPPPPSPTPSASDATLWGSLRRPSPTPARKRAAAAPGCRDYSRAYTIAKAGKVLIKVTVCRGAYSGTVKLADTAPKDGSEVCAQLRGHVAGSGDVFISTPVMASKDGATQGFNNGPQLRYGVKTHKRQDWVQVNAGTCRRSSGDLSASWLTHDRLAAG